MVPSTNNNFLPLKGMLMIHDVYLRNFLILPMLEFMSEVLMYGGFCIHELSPSFFYYIRGFQNMLLDQDVTPALDYSHYKKTEKQSRPNSMVKW